ncbi:LacI family transcriptional regulator [Cellulomonas aerilata]|uniref:LacI family transcriptional regulator n=1 Tax=Cellulomonas aerilata TaxID=515326 RepID=A0A512D8D7_9CELL|nr:LacI family transcriptional regulator [Cellulomonas aerilata]
MPVSARDVARVAGVSVSTVSRALTRPDDVAPETRTRVLDVARGLGYLPNPAARSLITGRTGNIGLVVPDLENPFFASITKGFHARARSFGYAAFIADSDEDPAAEPELVRNLAKQVDGLVLCSPRGPEEVIAGMARDCPLVLVNRTCGDVATVTVDDHDGVRQAMVYLQALGHRRIAFAGGPRASWSNARRLSAFRSVGAQHPDTELVELGFFSPHVSGGTAAADLLIASGATAALAYNDLVAFGLLEGLRRRGVVVPRDMSLVGIDDIPMSGLAHPGLTSVGTPLVNVGRAAVDTLVAMVRDPTAPALHQDDLPVQLVVRGSTAPRRTAPAHAGPG